jgi:glycosyltransferase involved in cell wall biosynthesis
VRAHLVVAGDGPLRTAVAECAAGAGLSDRVHLLGHRDDVEGILGGIDVLVLTSDDEGIPGVVIEAQMTGCPIVTFPFAAAAALVAKSRTGIVLARPEPREMAEEVAELLRDADARQQMGERGRAQAASFTAERAAARYDKCITGLLERRGLETRSR